jgi:two-component system, OmpR family, response regulator ResD
MMPKSAPKGLQRQQRPRTVAVVTSFLRNSFGMVGIWLSAPRCRHGRSVAVDRQPGFLGSGRCRISIGLGSCCQRRASCCRPDNDAGWRRSNDAGRTDVLETEVVNALQDLTGARVLVVDDDVTVGDVLTLYLQRAGFAVDRASDGFTALASAAASPPDLVVLDLMLPGVPGLEVCRRLRRTSDVPVVMLTALGEESDRIVGLEFGADDYVTKPFSPKELTLRVQSILRRTRQGGELDGPSSPVRDSALVVDPRSRKASRNGVPLALTVREFDLLAYLMTHPRRVFSRADLLQLVWHWDFGDQSTVTVHVRRLREKVEDDPQKPVRIVTVWGVGYRYEPVDE